MEWIQSIIQAIHYIENNLKNKITVEDVSKQIYASDSHFQRIFSAVTGITIGEYIRNRRLSMAGLDLLLENNKILDIAMRYHYNTSESFSKAFTRFHGFPPSDAKKNGNQLKCFDPITINVIIQGGFNLSRKIMENDQGIRLIREKFEYRHVGKLRFIGINLKLNPGISFQETIDKIAPLLEPLMLEYASEITDYCFLEHYQGQFINEDYLTRVTGRFFKAGTPVPKDTDFKNINGFDGLYYFDIPTENIGLGIYSGDESFGGDTFDAYVFTRDQILSDGITIPFPESYWTAVQFIEGEPKKGKYRFGYMFGVGAINS